MTSKTQNKQLEPITFNHRSKQGIYQIRNKKDGKIYIGETKNLYIRKCGHLSDLRKNKSTCRVLQNAFNKHGEENFVFEIICIVNCDANVLTEIEKKFIKFYDSTNRNIGYNITSGGNGYDGRGAKHKCQKLENNSNSKLTNKQRKEIKLLFDNKTNTVIEIAEIYKIHQSSVHRIIKYYYGKRKPKSKTTDKQKDKIYKLWKEKKKSFVQLAKIYNVDKSTIQRIINQKRDKPVDVKVKNPKKGKIPNEIKQEIYYLHTKKKYTAMKLFEIYDIHPRTIFAIIRKIKLENI